MDGQNFQNDNGQNYYGSYGTQPAEPVPTGAPAEPAADQNTNSYQDYTAQYSDPLYSTGGSYNANSNNNSYGSNDPYGNTANNSNSYTGNSYTGNSYTGNSYTGNSYTGNAYTDSSNMYTNNAEVYGNVPPVEEKKTPGASVASLILGISGILLDCCCGVGSLFGLIGLILGIVGNRNQKSGVGTAGIICSAIALVIGILMIIYFFVIGGMAYMEEMM